MPRLPIEEKEKMLAAPYGYNIPLQDFYTCAVSVDCVIFGYADKEVKVLLIKRGAEPFKGKWALPGDLMYPDEGLSSAANRVLKSLTGIENVYMEQAGCFGETDRHPVGRVVTVGYYALVNIEDYAPAAHSWAKQLKWHPISMLPKLAFDHNDVLFLAKQRLQENINTAQVGLNLLPEKFTLKDMQYIYEHILEKKLDKGNFRKKMLASDALEMLQEMETNVNHRPAKLYKVKNSVKA